MQRVYTSRNRKYSISGFTLSEMLIVVAIISIIVTGSIFTLNNSLKAARDNRRRGDLNLLKSALEFYYAKHKEYPIDTFYSWERICGSTPTTDLSILETEGFIDTLPCDPVNNTQYWYRFDPNGSSAVGCPSGTGCDTYCLYALMETTGTFYGVKSSKTFNYTCPGT